MGQGTHENYLHALPADNSVKGARLNLTFRKTRPINNPYLATDIAIREDKEDCAVEENVDTMGHIDSKKEQSRRTVVVNLKHTSDYDVYVGRPSKWGNPFVMGKDGNREQVIQMYKDYILKRADLLDALHELRGKRIACNCKPENCHGDILAELADQETDHN
jgi:hypothetical protein